MSRVCNKNHAKWEAIQCYLNFSFITHGRQDLHNFEKFTEPVIRVLRDLGINAGLQGKSDIFVEGKKVAGNAQFAATGRMFSHGTILFDTNLENMLRAINPRQAKIESKAVQSIRSFVTNIREHLSEEMDIAQFRRALLTGIFGGDEVPNLRRFQRSARRGRTGNAAHWAALRC